MPTSPANSVTALVEPGRQESFKKFLIRDLTTYLHDEEAVKSYDPSDETLALQGWLSLPHLADHIISRLAEYLATGTRS